MKKSTKAAAAAGVASVLLMGGAGSLAYWTASGSAAAGSITAGSLSLGTGTCDASWKYAAGKAGAGTAVTKYVPGDVVTKSCTFSVTASGDNLSATIAAPTSVAYTQSGSANSLNLTNAITYGVTSGSTTRTVANGGILTSADNGATVTAPYVATVPYGNTTTGTGGINAIDTQGITTTLGSLAVSLTQANPN